MFLCRSKREIGEFDLRFVLIEMLQNLKFLRQKEEQQIALEEMTLKERCLQKERETKDVYSDVTSLIHKRKMMIGVSLLEKEAEHILKNNQRIINSLKEKNNSRLFEYQSYFEQVFWSSQKIQNYSLQNFKRFVEKHFPSYFTKTLLKFEKLDSELKFYLDQNEPTSNEILTYLQDFQEVYDVSIKDIPKKGQELNQYELEDVIVTEKDSYI